MAHPHFLYASFMLVLLLWPLVVIGQIQVNLRDTPDPDAQGNLKYSADLRLQTGALPLGQAPETALFPLVLKAQYTQLSFNCTRKTTKANFWALRIGDDGGVASTFPSDLGSIQVVCNKKHGKNIASLSSSPNSFPSQVLPLLKPSPQRFATVVYEPTVGGSLYFGRSRWVQLVGSSPERTRVPLTFVNIPLKLVPSGGYQIELTGISFKSSLTAQKVQMEMDINQRFTKLPKELYQFLVGELHREASEKKIAKASTSYGKLTECYQLKPEKRSSFQNVTMAFGGKLQWITTGGEYLVQKPRSGNVFCFAFLEAAAGSPGVIGTMQQTRRVVEYQLDKKILAVSLRLVGGLISP